MKTLLPVFFSLLFSLQLFAEEVRPVSLEDLKKSDYFYLESLRLKFNNKPTEAFQALEYALTINPFSAAALYEISSYYSVLKQDSLALDALKKAVKYEPDIVEYKLRLAAQYRDSRKFKEAVALYEELIRNDPGNTDLNFNLIELYIRLQDFEAAIQALDNAELVLGMHQMFSLQKYNLYNQLGDSERALSELIKLSEKYPLDSKYLYILGDAYLSQNNPDKALEQYQKAHQLDPLDSMYAISMLNYYNYKQDDQAINDLFVELMEKHSQEVELHRIYANFLLSQKKQEEARFQFKVVTEMDPEDYDAWQNLLSMALQDSNMEEVISVCNDALIHFQDVPEFYFYKGIALYQQERFQEALSVYQDGLQFISSMNRAVASSFYGQIGDIHYQIGDYESAYKSYDKSLEYNENNTLVLNNYAYFLSLESKDLDKAEKMSSKTVQIEPNNPTYLDTYAWIFFKKGNYNLAKFYIESAIAKGGDNPEIHEHYGDILFKLGNVDQAVKEWETALSLYDENTDKSLLEQKIKNRSYVEN